jgi:hypothetical protein
MKLRKSPAIASTMAVSWACSSASRRCSAWPCRAKIAGLFPLAAAVRHLFGASLIAAFFVTVPVMANAASTLTTLWSFRDYNATPPDGAVPVDGLIMDASGTLYGTTGDGGSAAPFGEGVVFKLTPPSTAGGSWTETVLYSFCSQPNCSDGNNPEAGLISDKNGALYGTTVGLTGVVFKLTPPSTAGGPWTETVLYSFCAQPNCSDGSLPRAGLIMDAPGTLYGTTTQGGDQATNCPFHNDGCGTVFKLTPPSTAGGPWTETVLHSFCSQPNCSDGSFPFDALISDKNGVLYGTTADGGSVEAGTVFEITGSGFIPPGVLAGTPGSANCIGKSISGLAQEYGTFLNAAITLGYSSQGLQNEVMIYCGG